MTKFLTEQQQDGILPGDPANGGVKALAFSLDGQRLASASGDGTVRRGIRLPARLSVAPSRPIPAPGAA